MEVVPVLTKFASKQIPLGESVEVLVGFRNAGDEALNVTAIYGTLSNAAFIQNLTALALGDYATSRLGQVVEASKEASFLYRFNPAPQLPPGDYQVGLHVQYEGREGHFVSTFFNQTVELVEKVGPVDFQLVFILSVFIGAFGLTWWIVYELGIDNPVVKKASRWNASSETCASLDPAPLTR